MTQWALRVVVQSVAKCERGSIRSSGPLSASPQSHTLPPNLKIILVCMMDQTVIAEQAGAGAIAGAFLWYKLASPVKGWMTTMDEPKAYAC